ncbi:MAG TPA: carboxypeptidase-like regulatory domain-containing protein, partial [Paludibacter sp.]|nr:carboxypeptidase-like regulatory domain-containing protein [Paludibacter sp.]
MSLALMAQNKSISGVVTNADGTEKLIGVTVVVKGTSNGTVTNLDGQFTIKSISNEDILVFSMIGMKKTEVKIGNNTTIRVALSDDTKLIDEVVVTGYTSQKKADLTGAVS